MSLRWLLISALLSLAAGCPRDTSEDRSVTERTSVRFSGPKGMKLSYYLPGAGGKPERASMSMAVPCRYNFLQAATYRFKLSSIPGRPGLELNATLEVVPSNTKTRRFLERFPVPLAFTAEDLGQVTSGKYLVKVVYLPRGKHQDQDKPREVVSSHLEPGDNPITEALTRGNILLVVRVEQTKN